MSALLLLAVCGDVSAAVAGCLWVLCMIIIIIITIIIIIKHVIIIMSVFLERLSM